MNADAFIQQNSGGFDGVGNVTLPTPTVAGRRLIVAAAATGGAVPLPSGWTADYAQGALSLIYSKATADSEDTWTFGAAGVAFEYDVFEVEGLDPIAPIDVKPVTRGSGGSTGVTNQSTTYDGFILGVHAAAGTVGATTILTFDTHSDGYAELSDHGHASGGSFLPTSIATCHRFVSQLDAWECVCDCPGGAAEEGVLVVYTAEGARRAPTLSWFWAFPPELIGATGLDTGPANSRFWESQAGTPTIDADGLRLQATAAAANITGRSPNFQFTAGMRASIQALRIRFNTLPSADLELAATTPNTGAGARTTTLSYRAATGQLGLQIGGGTEQLSTMTVSADQWLDVDIRSLARTDDDIADWRVDDGGGPIDQPQVSTIQTLTLPTAFAPRLGWSAAATGDVSFEYAVYSVRAGHYPLGTYQFMLLGPDPAATPTVSGTAASFRRYTANGTLDGSHDATAIRDALGDWPPVTGSTADGLAVVTASASDYIEIPMATHDPAGTASIRLVLVLAPIWAASGTVATIRLSGWDGTDLDSLFPEADPGADNGAVPVWVCRLWQPTAGGGAVPGWDQTRLDSAAIRVGSNDANPDIGLHALGLLVCLQEVVAQPLFGEIGAPLRVEQDLDPASGGIQRLRAYTPADASATLIYDLDEVEQTPVDVPADSNPLTVVLSAADTTVVSRISLTIDESA